MLNQFLEVTAHSSNLPINEALGYGLPMSLFGFAVLFAVLAILWGILTLFKLFFYTIPQNKKNGGNSSSTPNANIQKMTLSDGGAAVLEPTFADGELIAAITAAIEAFRSQTGSVGGFRVVSFKKRK